jgi:hypothetical protein
MPVPDIAKDVVRAFHYCLKEQVLEPDQAMDMASLMLELASLYQYLAMQREAQLPAEQLEHLAQCRARVAQLSVALGVANPIGK